MFIRPIVVVAFGACVFFAACNKASDNDVKIDSGAGSAMTPSPAATMPPPAPALSDANIAALLDEANAADSADGSIAATKGTSAGVKTFGKTMMTDHHMLRMAGLDLVKKLSITPMPPASSTLATDAQSWHDSLTAMPKGAAWDKAYIDHEVMAHQMVLQTIDMASAATQTADVKALLDKAKPAVQGHLDHAMDLQSKLPAGK